MRKTTGNADNPLLRSKNEVTHELSVCVIFTGLWGSCNSFGMFGDDQPMAIPADNINNTTFW